MKNESWRWQTHADISGSAHTHVWAPTTAEEMQTDRNSLNVSNNYFQQSATTRWVQGNIWKMLPEISDKKAEFKSWINFLFQNYNVSFLLVEPCWKETITKKKSRIHEEEKCKVEQKLASRLSSLSVQEDWMCYMCLAQLASVKLKNWRGRSPNDSFMGLVMEHQSQPDPSTHTLNPPFAKSSVPL